MPDKLEKNLQGLLEEVFQIKAYIIEVKGALKEEPVDIPWVVHMLDKIVEVLDA